MAQTATHVREVQTDASSDQHAWLAAGAANKYKIHDNHVWGFTGDLLVSVPAPKGFAEVAEPMRNFMFRPIMQMVLTRVAQTATGNVQDAVDAAMNGLALPAPEQNDAREAIYRKFIRSRIEAQLGAEKLKAMTPGEFEATCEKYREAAFDRAINLALDAAKNKEAKTSTSAKPRKKSNAVELAEI